jgi:hypothetical protein
MNDKPRKTGLGAKAFFKQPSSQPEQELTAERPAAQDQSAELSQPADQVQAATPAKKPAEDTKAPQPQSEKIKTTINLSSDTLALLDALKIDARKQRRKATYSDILDEAIRELATKKGVKP